MTDEEALKARVDEAEENLNYYLRNYHRLIAVGFRKSVLDAEIEYLKEFLKEHSARWKGSLLGVMNRAGIPCFRN